MDLTALSDEGIVAKIQGDDPATANLAFVELFRRYFPLLQNYVARGFRPDPSGDAEDVALAAFTRLFAALRERRVSNLEDKGSVRALLYKAALNQARDASRRVNRRGRSRVGGVDLFNLAELPGRTDAETEALIKDFQEVLLARLNPRERAVAELLAGGFTTQEICERMGLSQPTVWRLRRRLEEVVAEMLRR
jgi:RNA polymerase sigma factor (sigma-70 family)